MAILARAPAIGYTFSVTFEPNETVKAVSFAIITAGAVQGFFLGALFLSRSGGQPRDRRAPDALLSALMFAFTANILHAAILRPLAVSGGAANVAFEPFQLLFGPLVYAYARALAMPEPLRSHIRPALKTLFAFLTITAFVALAGTHAELSGRSRRLLDAVSWIVALIVVVVAARAGGSAIGMVRAHLSGAGM